MPGLRFYSLSNSRVRVKFESTRIPGLAVGCYTEKNGGPRRRTAEKGRQAFWELQACSVTAKTQLRNWNQLPAVCYRISKKWKTEPANFEFHYTKSAGHLSSVGLQIARYTVNRLLDFYLYLFRSRFFFLRNRQAQHAVFELRADPFHIGIRRQSK